jgi:4-carboxymuconolactone decarboxylase
VVDIRQISGPSAPGMAPERNPDLSTEVLMRKVPERFRQFATTYPGIAAAYEKLAGECRKAGPLNDRDRCLVRLGIAAGSNVEGSVHSQVRKALDLGMKPEEIRHAMLQAVTAIGFPRMMRALTWAEDILGKDQISGGKT